VTDPLVPPFREGDPSSSLLVRVRAQDPAAWDRLVRLYTPLVYSWCQRKGLREPDAEDVYQDVFQAVWCSIHTFHRDQPGDSFRGWLRVVTRNKLRDHFRRKRDQEVARGGSDAQARAEQVPEPELPDDDETVRAETSLLCRRAVALIQAEFEPKTWQAFEAVALHEQTPVEVADVLKISTNAVYLAVSRVRKRLREEFEELLDS
jgi:RNA polymerase sigma-70 factor (ECF subfamily)